MKIPKLIDNLYKRIIIPIRCQRCGRLLYRDSDRKAGISRLCARELEQHRYLQEMETRANQFFFTVPFSTTPSKYYDTISACRESAVKRVGSKIWEGTYDAPHLTWENKLFE